MKRNIFYGIELLLLIIIIAMMIFAMWHVCDKAYNRYEVTATVTEKVVKNYSGRGKYLIFAEDKNGTPVVMEITDSVLALRFNSSDVYASLKVDSTYRFTVGGQRNEFFSWYPNIYEYRELSNSESK